MPNIKPIDIPEKKKGGIGGLFAKIGGGLLSAVGAAAAPFSGGASAALVPAGAAIATGGSLLDPGKTQSVAPVSPLESAGKADPEVQLAQLGDAMAATNSLPRDQQEQVTPTLMSAQDEVKRRIAALKGPGRP